MLIDNLQEGLILKNHKTMCETLGIPFKNNTNSKKSQLNELQRYCKLVKSGHSITILEVYKNAKHKIENRGKSSVYGNLIQFLVTDLLATTKKGHLSVSRNKLLQTINMINVNYGWCSKNIKKLSQYSKVDEAVIYDFYNTSNSNFKNAIETALRNLEDKRVLWFETIIKVREADTGTYRAATKQEKDIIWDCEKQILNELNYESVSQVRCSKHWNTFKAKTDQLLHSKTNIKFYYNAYNISINKKYIDTERDKLLDLVLEDSKRIEYKEELNTTVIKSLIRNAEKRHEKGFYSKKMSLYRLSDNYTDNIKKLIDLLIDDNQENLHDYINKEENISVEMEEEIIARLDDLFR